MAYMNSTFSKRLRELREEKKINRHALSKELEFGGNVIEQLEKERYIPRLDVVIKLAQFFGVSVGYMAGEEER